MNEISQIPTFELYGETDRFPDVLHCERIKDRASARGWTITAHRHQQMVQLFQLEKGNCLVRIDQREIEFKAGEFLFLPARVVHAFDFQPNTEGCVLSFPMNVVNSIGPGNSETVGHLSRVIQAASTRSLNDSIRLLCRQFADSGPFRTQIIIALAHTVLAMVAEADYRNVDDAESLPQHRLLLLDALIAEHLSEGWGATDYARALALTTGHLARLCRAEKGMTTSTYIETAAMTEACRLLAFTRMAVSEVAYRLGYRDPSYFSKRFRRVQGVSPSDYRGELWGPDAAGIHLSG